MASRENANSRVFESCLYWFGNNKSRKCERMSKKDRALTSLTAKSNLESPRSVACLKEMKVMVGVITFSTSNLENIYLLGEGCFGYY